MTVNSERLLLIFRLGKRMVALPLDAVHRIVPMADLARPPALPEVLEGILNWAGTAVPVVRLARLLRLPHSELSLYSMLVLMKSSDGSDKPVALLVDSVREILKVTNDELITVSERDSFNACIDATASVREQVIYLLSPERILLARERESLDAYRSIEQLRVNDWRPEA